MEFNNLLIALTVLSVLFGVIGYVMAGKKGRRPVLWLVLGAFIGPLAIIVLFFLKPISSSATPS